MKTTIRLTRHEIDWHEQHPGTSIIHSRSWEQAFILGMKHLLKIFETMEDEYGESQSK